MHKNRKPTEAGFLRVGRCVSCFLPDPQWGSRNVGAERIEHRRQNDSSQEPLVQLVQRQGKGAHPYLLTSLIGLQIIVYF